MRVIWITAIVVAVLVGAPDPPADADDPPTRGRLTGPIKRPLRGPWRADRDGDLTGYPGDILSISYKFIRRLCQRDPAGSGT